MWWAIPVGGLIGYAIGSIQFGLIVGRLTRGVDIREYGSGATGATNVIRTAGAKAGVLVIILDMAKGVVAVYIGLGLGHLAGIDAHDDRAWVAALAAFGAVLGHVWPLWFGFRGGKAVATGFGAALSMNPIASVALIPVAALIVGAVRIMSVMSILMPWVLTAVFIALAALDISPPAYAAYAAATSVLITFRHRENIQRLLAGTEPKIGQGGQKRPARGEVASPR